VTAGQQDGQPPASESSAERLSAEEVAALHAEYAERLLAFLQGLLHDSDAAREALQNTFQKVLEVGHTARPESIRGWLFRVAYHEGLALRRKSASQERAVRRLEASGTSRESDSPDRWLERQEDIERVRLALQQIPADQRYVVERRIEHDETFAVIAARLKVPLGTVLTRMRLALEKLQKRLSEGTVDGSR
jgi:RNA polymerase sigma-70 factor (ECF subfamily)